MSKTPQETQNDNKGVTQMVAPQSKRIKRPTGPRIPKTEEKLVKVQMIHPYKLNAELGEIVKVVEGDKTRHLYEDEDVLIPDTVALVPESLSKFLTKDNGKGTFGFAGRRIDKEVVRNSMARAKLLD